MAPYTPTGIQRILNRLPPIFEDKALHNHLVRTSEPEVRKLVDSFQWILINAAGSLAYLHIGIVHGDSEATSVSDHDVCRATPLDLDVLPVSDPGVIAWTYIFTSGKPMSCQSASNNLKDDGVKNNLASDVYEWDCIFVIFMGYIWVPESKVVSTIQSDCFPQERPEALNMVWNGRGLLTKEIRSLTSHCWNINLTNTVVQFPTADLTGNGLKSLSEPKHAVESRGDRCEPVETLEKLDHLVYDLQVETDKLGENRSDLLILVMGASGSGKSSFINLLFNTGVAPVPSGSGDCSSQQISAYHLPDNKFPDNRVVLVDMPGFDYRNCNEWKILENISGWLARSYRGNAKVAGIVYCHDITQKKWEGSTKRSFNVFEKLCGPAAAETVVLMTTMWDNAVVRGPLEYREECLKNTYWKDMISRGSSVHRGKLTNESAYSTIYFLLAKNAFSVPLQIQRDLVENKKALEDTEAGLTLTALLRELLYTYKKRVKTLRKEGGNRQAVLDLEVEIRKIEEQLGGLKTPILRSLRSLLSGCLGH